MSSKNPKREPGRDTSQPKTGKAEQRPRGDAGYSPADSRKQRKVDVKHKISGKSPKQPPEGS